MEANGGRVGVGWMPLVGRNPSACPQLLPVMITQSAPLLSIPSARRSVWSYNWCAAIIGATILHGAPPVVRGDPASSVEAAWDRNAGGPKMPSVPAVSAITDVRAVRPAIYIIEVGGESFPCIGV